MLTKTQSEFILELETRGPWAIISAEKSYLERQHNAARTANLRAELINRYRTDPIELRGRWARKTEVSFLAQISIFDAVEVGSNFWQDSVITNSALVSCDGKGTHYRILGIREARDLDIAWSEVELTDGWFRFVIEFSKEESK